MRVARSDARKPIVAIKSGTTSASSRRLARAPGTLAGSEKAYDAAFKQVGVTQAGSVQDLLDYAIDIARQPLPTSDAVAVAANAVMRHHGVGYYRAGEHATGFVNTPNPAKPRPVARGCQRR